MSIAARRLASRTTRLPTIVMITPAEMSASRLVVKSAPVLTGQPAGGLDPHARQSHQPVRQRQAAREDRPCRRVQPELPEPGFGRRRRQTQERQRTQSPASEIQVDRVVEPPAPVKLPGHARPPGWQMTP